MTEKTKEELRAEQRASIAVTSGGREETEKNEGTGDEEEGENKPSDDDEGSKSGDTEGDKSGEQENEGEGEGGEGEKKEEELTAADVAKLKKTIARLQKRVDKTTAEKAATAKELADAKAALEAKPDKDKVLTEDEVERRADKLAEQRQIQRDFTNSCNKLFKEATKVDKEFKAKIDDVVEELGGIESGGIPPSMIGILDDIDNGGAVLAHLANNVEDYEEIRGLPLGRMAYRLNKIAVKLEEAVKKPVAKVSKTPDPVQPIGGNKSSPNIITGRESMEDYVRIRLEQKKQRQKLREAGLRP